MYAGFWKRFAAYLVDNFILGMGTLIIFVPLGIAAGLAGAASGTDVSDSIVFNIVIYALGISMSWLYFALFECSSKQATPGKMALGIIVADMDGGRLSFGRATGRYFGKLVSSLVLSIGYIIAAFTDKKQALHDLMAGTLVVDKNFIPAPGSQNTDELEKSLDEEYRSTDGM